MLHTVNHRYALFISPPPRSLTRGRAFFRAIFCVAALCANFAWATNIPVDGLTVTPQGNWSTDYTTTVSSSTAEEVTLTVELSDDEVTYSGTISDGATGKAKVGLIVTTDNASVLMVTKPQAYSGQTWIEEEATLSLRGTGTYTFAGDISSKSWAGYFFLGYDDDSIINDHPMVTISGAITYLTNVAVLAGTLTLSNPDNTFDELVVGYNGDTEGVAPALVNLTAENVLEGVSAISMAQNSEIKIVAGDQVFNNFKTGEDNTTSRKITTLDNQKLTFNTNRFACPIGAVITGGGNVEFNVKNGKYDIILIGENDYTGTTTISGNGILALNKADDGKSVGNLGTGAVTVQSGATLEVRCTQTIVAPSISGNGNLYIGNSKVYVDVTAQATFNGTISQTGGTTTIANKCTLALNNTSASTLSNLNGPGTLTSKADLTLSVASGTRTFSGTLSASGKDITKTGSGIQEFSGSTNYRNMTVSAGTLKLSGTATLGTGTTSIAQNSTLEFAHADARTLTLTAANKVSGQGSFKKSGTGSLKIDAADGAFATSSCTLTAGRLDMKGAYTGVLNLSGGTFSPGNSAGTLTVTGSTNIATTAALIFEITSASTYDVLNAGDLTVDALEFVTLDVQGTYVEGTEVPIATYNSLSGSSKDVNQWLDTDKSPENWSLTAKDNTVYAKYGKSSPSGTETPEPSTWALLLLGAFGLLWLKRRK